MRARFKYKVFRGTKKEDPDAWLEDFDGIARANGEWEVQLSILAGVLQGEARPWFNEQPWSVRSEWDLFEREFIKEFRKIGGSNDALIEIGNEYMRSSDTVRSYVQRLRRIQRKMDPQPVESMMVSWFLNGLPTATGVNVRAMKPRTLEEAVVHVQDWQIAETIQEKCNARNAAVMLQRRREGEEESDLTSSPTSSDDNESRRRRKLKKKLRKKTALVA